MGLGMGELVILLIIVLLVFGAGKLPQIGDALGRSIKNFKRAAAGSDEIDVTPVKKPAEISHEGTPGKVAAPVDADTK